MSHPAMYIARRSRSYVLKSRLARSFWLRRRLAVVLNYNYQVAAESARWLLRSRELSNYTYHLTPISEGHLAWCVAEATGSEKSEIERFFLELANDHELRAHIEERSAVRSLRGVSDTDARYARRMGWYAMVRSTKPAVVVETGVDKGLGTCVLAAALLRNAQEGSPGRVKALDVDPDAGGLIGAPYSSVVDIIIGDSVDSINNLVEPVGVFIHDSDHSEAHETAELEAVQGILTAKALLVTDNAHVTAVLSRFADRTGRRFLAFLEQPQNHWYPGGSLGVAFNRY